MIENTDVLSLNYYNYKQPFSGSYKGMRYRLEKVPASKDEEGNIIKPNEMKVTYWPEPFSFENTNPAMMTEKSFPFSDEGKEQAVAWLNEEYARGEWHEGFTFSQLKKLKKQD